MSSGENNITGPADLSFRDVQLAPTFFHSGLNSVACSLLLSSRRDHSDVIYKGYKTQASKVEMTEEDVEQYNKEQPRHGTALSNTMRRVNSCFFRP